jgi:hypothetical protein
VQVAQAAQTVFEVVEHAVWMYWFVPQVEHEEQTVFDVVVQAVL